MWNKINSPIVITIIAIASLFVLKATMKPKLATEIRGAYNELTAIVEDGTSDAEKSKAIQKLIEEIGSQIRTGLSNVFESKDANKNEKNPYKIYLDTKRKVVISDIKYIDAKWKGRENFIFKVKNNSEKYIRSLRLNYEFYRDGELIDVENKWISGIKILEPNQEVIIKGERSYPQGTKDEDIKKYKSTEVRITVMSFNVEDLK